jgi:hypothetical protein
MSTQKADITLIILTFNEEMHIRRVIESTSNIVSRIIVVDSFSKDQTITNSHIGWELKYFKILCQPGATI